MDILKKEMERKKREREALFNTKLITTNTTTTTGDGVRFIRQADFLQYEEEMRLIKQQELDQQRQLLLQQQSLQEQQHNHITSTSINGTSTLVNKKTIVISPSSTSSKLNTLTNAEEISSSNGFEEHESTKRQRIEESEDILPMTSSAEEIVKDPQDNSKLTISQKSSERQVVYDINAPFITRFSLDSSLTPEEIVYLYFKSLLRQWEYELEHREISLKNHRTGKDKTRAYEQCKDHIKPLFKLCKRKEVPRDIMNKLLEIVKCCEQGDFRTANDHYIRAAIGNSAWPIGLTMVGIHERSGREKISENKVAHVMNNELQRKYFTSVKRLMTYAQDKRPDVPPSMKVLT